MHLSLARGETPAQRMHLGGILLFRCVGMLGVAIAHQTGIHDVKMRMLRPHYCLTAAILHAPNNERPQALRRP